MPKHRDQNVIPGANNQNILLNEPNSKSRRGFLGGVGGAVAASVLGAPALTGLMSGESKADTYGVPRNLNPRRQQAFLIRLAAANAAKNSRARNQSANSDELIYSGKIANYSKGLPHNALGEVDINAYNAFATALDSGDPNDFAAIPMGGVVKLANPQAALAFQLEGTDSHALSIPMFTPFASEAAAGEMAEIYWHALTRDIPFSQYGNEAVTAAAIADLATFGNFSGVNAGNLFRGQTPGENNGPLLSQFMWLDVPYGRSTIIQQYKVPAAGDVHMTRYADWLNIQNGGAPTSSIIFDGAQRYIRNAHDLSEWVHVDFSFQGFLNAALILMGMGAGRDSHPYSASANQGAFITFGGPNILDMVTKAAYAGLKAAWYQKWLVHRALRPEVFAGRVHNHMTGAANYPVHSKLLNSNAVAQTFSQHGTYLLPMAFAEGSPTHPSYPAGHAAISGACVTVLKAFFNETYVIRDAVVASDDGLSLDSYTDTALTVGGELNKLASNIALGRDYAGVHYRQDGLQGMLLGEQVAINLLRECKLLYNEVGTNFTITKFSGSTINI